MNEPILEDKALIQQYRIKTCWSRDDNAFVAEMPELPGCMADGATDKEARQNIELIAQEWLDTARLLGRPIPEPQRDPEPQREEAYA